MLPGDARIDRMAAAVRPYDLVRMPNPAYGPSCLGYTRAAMPTYEYVCKRCGHLFEIVQSMKDDTLTECPECGGELRKVFAPPAISFKGSGFYATDHGKKKSSPAGSEKKKDASGTEKKSDAKSSQGTGSSGSSGGGDAGAAAEPEGPPAVPRTEGLRSTDGHSRHRGVRGFGVLRVPR